MRVLSWNVNGIRAVIRNGFWAWLAADRPDVLCLQETRIQREQLTNQMRNPPGYYAYWHSAQRKGYSGVATLCQEEPSLVQEGFGLKDFDQEGRVLVTGHPGFTLVNAYFPSGRRGQERVTYKIEFYDALLEYCVALRAQGHRVVVCGDDLSPRSVSAIIGKPHSVPAGSASRRGALTSADDRTTIEQTRRLAS